MAMGRRNRESQEQLFLVTHQMPQSQGHPFYLKLNKLLAAYSFDDFCEQVCEEFYARGGRPGLAPGIYFLSASSRTSARNAASHGDAPTR